MNLDISISVPKEEAIQSLEMILSDVNYHINEVSMLATCTLLGKKNLFTREKTLKEAKTDTTVFLRTHSNWLQLKEETEIKLRLLKHLPDTIMMVSVPLELFETMKLYNVKETV